MSAADRPATQPPTSATAYAERTYRRALHAYPPAWRRSHGEEVLGVLMETAGPRASTRETLWLVAHGLRMRLLAGREPGAWRNGSAAAATAISASLASLAVAQIIDLLTQLAYAAHPSPGVESPLYLDPLWPAYLLWLVTCGLLLAGRPLAGRVAAWIAVAAYLVTALPASVGIRDGAGPLTGLDTLGIFWGELALGVPTLLLAVLVSLPGGAEGGPRLLGRRVVLLALGVGSTAGLLDALGGISDAWAALLPGLVMLVVFAARGVLRRAGLLWALAFVYVPLVAQTDGSGSRLSQSPVPLAITLAVLPLLGAAALALLIRMTDADPRPRLALARALDRFSASVRAGVEDRS